MWKFVLLIFAVTSTQPHVSNNKVYFVGEESTDQRRRLRWNLGNECIESTFHYEHPEIAIEGNTIEHHDPELSNSILHEKIQNIVNKGEEFLDIEASFEEIYYYSSETGKFHDAIFKDMRFISEKHGKQPAIWDDSQNPVFANYTTRHTCSKTTMIGRCTLESGSIIREQAPMSSFWDEQQCMDWCENQFFILACEFSPGMGCFKVTKDQQGIISSADGSTETTCHSCIQNVIHPGTHMNTHQGSIGNCWALAAMNAIVYTHPDYVRDHMIKTNLNEAGIYAVTMFNGGRSSYVVIDDIFPINEECASGTNFNECSYENGGSAFTYRPEYDHIEFWPSMVEKAMFKMFGEAQDVDGGHISNGFKYLTGAPATTFVFEIESMPIWNQIRYYCDRGWAMGASAKSLPHAYSILCAYKLERKQPNNDGEIYEHLILMMNPWGRSEGGACNPECKNPEGTVEWADNWAYNANHEHREDYNATTDSKNPKFDELKEGELDRIGFGHVQDGQFLMTPLELIQMFKNPQLVKMEKNYRLQFVQQRMPAKEKISDYFTFERNEDGPMYVQFEYYGSGEDRVFCGRSKRFNYNMNLQIGLIISENENETPVVDWSVGGDSQNGGIYWTQHIEVPAAHGKYIVKVSGQGSSFIFPNDRYAVNTYFHNTVDTNLQRECNGPAYIGEGTDEVFKPCADRQLLVMGDSNNGVTFHEISEVCKDVNCEPCPEDMYFSPDDTCCGICVEELYLLMDGCPSDQTWNLDHHYSHENDQIGEVQCCKEENEGSICTRFFSYEYEWDRTCISGNNEGDEDDLLIKYTWTDARNECFNRGVGYRLCDKKELIDEDASGCCGQGCGHDQDWVWTRTTIDKPQVYVKMEGDQVCLTGELITTQKDCQKAAEDLGLGWGGQWTDVPSQNCGSASSETLDISGVYTSTGLNNFNIAQQTREVWTVSHATASWSPVDLSFNVDLMELHGLFENEAWTGEVHVTSEGKASNITWTNGDVWTMQNPSPDMLGCHLYFQNDLNDCLKSFAAICQVQVVEAIDLGPTGCADGFICKEGEGDCDNDNDCSGILICFHRNNGEETAGYDFSNIASDTDICIQPLPIKAISMGDDGCTRETCGDGQGDCDNFMECTGDLKCFERAYGETRNYYDFSEIPDNYDICVQPNLQSMNYGLHGCSAQTCGEGQGNCESDDQCRGSLICFQREAGEDSSGYSFHGMPMDYNFCIKSEVIAVDKGENFCTEEYPCSDGEAECTRDSQCHGDLICMYRSADERRAGYDLSAVRNGRSVCVQSIIRASGGKECGELPCSEGEGHCRSDEECFGALRCYIRTGNEAVETGSSYDTSILADDVNICVSAHPIKAETPTGEQRCGNGPYAPCHSGDAHCYFDEDCVSGTYCFDRFVSTNKDHLRPDVDFSGLAWGQSPCLPRHKALYLGDSKCSVQYPCGSGFGGCQTNADCIENHVCLHRTGNQEWPGLSFDDVAADKNVCVPNSIHIQIGHRCENEPCKEGEYGGYGHSCSNDEHCFGNSICYDSNDGQNNRQGYDYTDVDYNSPQTNVCVRPVCCFTLRYMIPFKTKFSC